MKRLFGTDGIRGIVNKTLTGDLAYKVGLATAKLIQTTHFRDILVSPFLDKKPVVLIGTDTRPSKDLILSGVTCGLCAGGINVISIGVIPTPAVAYLTKHYHYASAGIMITASHNPKEYNGIKIIGPDGYKLHDRLEEQIENFISTMSEETFSNFFADSPGKVLNSTQKAKEDYMNYLRNLFPFNAENKLKIAVDCSNGAASSCKSIFKNFNILADVYNFDLDDGEHINEGCGSMHLEFIQSVVKKGGFDCGIAFDGDADRCIFVDANGEIVDGDYILAIIGSYFKQNGKLQNNAIVGTIMSNLGLVKFCETNQINFISTKVGDKYVLEEMIANGASLGGEQSGHIILKDFATTGDGILTALMILSIINKTRTPLHKLKNKMAKYPQVSTQIAANSEVKNAFVANIELQQKIQNLVYSKLGDDGRAVVRPSGTENYIRVMVEGKDYNVISKLLENIYELILKNT